MTEIKKHLEMIKRVFPKLEPYETFTFQGNRVYKLKSQENCAIGSGGLDTWVIIKNNDVYLFEMALLFENSAESFKEYEESKLDIIDGEVV